MNRKQKLHYFKHIVKRHLNDIRKDIEQSKNDMERNFYTNRYSVQLRDYARALNVQEKYLEKAVCTKSI